MRLIVFVYKGGTPDNGDLVGPCSKEDVADYGFESYLPKLL